VLLFLLPLLIIRAPVLILEQMDNFLAGRLFTTAAEDSARKSSTETTTFTKGNLLPSLSAISPKEPLEIIAAPLVVFGGGAAVVQMLLESLTHACIEFTLPESLLFASASTESTSLLEDNQKQRPRLRPPLAKTNPGVEVGLCLSGCGSRVSCDMLASTALNPQRGLAAVLISLELRGLSLSLTSYIPREIGAARASIPRAGNDDDLCKDVLSKTSPVPVSPSKQSRHPLSPASTLSAAADAAADAAATATAVIDDAAANFLALLGDCPCLNLLDLSSVTFTANQATLNPIDTLTTEAATKAEGSLVAAAETTAARDTEFSCGLSDAAVSALGRALSHRKSIRKLAIGGAPRVTDAALRSIGESIGQQLTDLSLYG